MDITSLGSTSPLTPATGVQGPSSTPGRDPDGDGDGGKHVRGGHRHGGGGMRSAMMDALQSLGLTLPAPGSAAAAHGSAAATSGSDSDGDDDGSGGSGSTTSVRQDMGQFMHTLFKAVKSDAASASSSNASGADAAGGASPFSTGLAALISQVSGGSAPAALQSAFDKLASDLQSSAGTGSGTSSGTSGSSPDANAASATQISLQAFLTKLQANLGYDSTAAAATTGNIVSTSA